MRFLPLGLLVALAGHHLAAATTFPPRNLTTVGETVVLPDFTVQGRKELPRPEAWQHSRLEDGTEVLSNAPERTARRLLRDFQMFQQALALAWPALGESQGYHAKTLILCGRRDKYDDFAPPDSGNPEWGSASRFVRNREQSAIILDLQSRTLNLAGTEDDAPGAAASFEVDADRQLYREYVRYLLSTAAQRPPPWLQEGIAQIVMAMEFAPDWVKLGALEESYPAARETGAGEGEAGAAPAGGAQVGDRGFHQVLRRRALLPMDEFFAVGADAPEATNPLGNNRWAKQAYAFVHLCLYGENGRYRPAFDEFTKRLTTQPASESLFKECFKMSYRDMLFVLRGYIDMPAHRTDVFKLEPDSPRFGGSPVVMRDATQAEVGRIKGDAQRLAGRINDALTSYSDAYVRGEREPILLASYGIAASETNQADRALPLLEAAAKAPGTCRPTAYIELARQRLLAARATAGTEGHISDAQFGTVMEPLVKARSIGLPLPGLYVVLANAWRAASTPPTLKDFALMGEGLRLFPQEVPLLFSVAHLYLRIGEPAAANQVAQIGLRFSATPEERNGFEQLLAALPPGAAR